MEWGCDSGVEISMPSAVVKLLLLKEMLSAWLSGWGDSGWPRWQTVRRSNAAAVVTPGGG
jgi:hypothetical protein